MPRRHKISTTVASETYAYLQSLVRSARAANLAQALDLALGRLRRADNRARLERDTAAYFEKLSDDAAREEARLEASLDQSAGEFDFES